MNLTEETAHNLVFEAQKLLKEKGYLEKDLVSANELFAQKKNDASDALLILRISIPCLLEELKPRQ